MSLKGILTQVRADAVQQGGGISDRAVTALTAFRRQALIASWIVLIATLAVFVASLAAALFFLNDPAKLKLVAGAFGVSLAGALLALRSVWKDWTQANLLLILIEEASDQQIQSLIEKLIRSL